MSKLSQKYLELEKIFRAGVSLDKEDALMFEMDEIWYQLTPEDIEEIHSVREETGSAYYQRYIDLRQALLDARNANAPEDIIVDQMNEIWDRLSQREIDLIKAEGSWQFIK